MNNPIFLDYAASTPTDPVVAESCSALCLGVFLPIRVTRPHGWQADEAVETALSWPPLSTRIRENSLDVGSNRINTLAVKG